MRRLGIMAFAAAVSGCASPAWDESKPQQCRVRTSSVTLSCLSARDGALSDCRVVEETAPGCGFAEAAMEAAARAKVRPGANWREGQRVSVTTRFHEDRSAGLDPGRPRA
ncbi:hypothetical protein [Brevundimonas sp.]|uniref:hypothetical protein n=1 Tax=Brevundimonas sp. TaxID=1871086 RepID=UPI002FC8D447